MPQKYPNDYDLRRYKCESQKAFEEDEEVEEEEE